MYLFPKIHKTLYDVHGRPVISNCRKPKKNPAIFRYQVMQNEWCYIQNSSDFTKKVKHLKNIADNALLVFPHVAILYPNAPHWVGLRALT